MQRADRGESDQAGLLDPQTDGSIIIALGQLHSSGDLERLRVNHRASHVLYADVLLAGALVRFSFTAAEEAEYLQPALYDPSLSASSWLAW